MYVFVPWLVQANTGLGIILRHVGKYDLVADFEAAEDLDVIHGGGAEFDVHAGSVRGAGVELEEAYGGVGFARDGAADVDDIGEALDFDGAVDAELGAGSLGQRAEEADIDGDSAVLSGGIDTDHTAGDEAVAGVDAGVLAEADILHLGFGDFEFGFELFGVGDFGEDGAGGDALADFDVHFLEDAIDTGADGELVDLLALEIVGGAVAFEADLLGIDLGADGIVGDGEALFLETDAVVEFGGFVDREAGFEIAFEVEAGEFHVAVGGELGLGVLGFEFGEGGALVELVAFEFDLEVGEGGFVLLDLPGGVFLGELHVGVAEDHDDVVGLDRLAAGAADDVFDAAIDGGGNPVYLLRSKATEAAHIALHGTALDRVDPDAAAVDGGKGRLEVTHAERDAGEGDETDDDP